MVNRSDQKDIELGLFGDLTKLSQILTNLVGNAIKFTDAYGKINLFVEGIENHEDETKLKFSV